MVLKKSNLKKIVAFMAIVSVLSIVGCSKGEKSKDNSKITTVVDMATTATEGVTSSTVEETSNTQDELSTEEKTTIQEVTTTQTPATTEKQTTTKKQTTTQKVTTTQKKTESSTIKQEETTTKHTHNFLQKTTAPTCTERGYTTYYCSCGEEYDADYISAKGHTEVIDKAVEATATSTGLTEGKHCSTCGYVLVAQTEIPKKNSPSEKSTFDYPVDKVLRTYSGLMNENDYNEFIIEDISIETKDTSETQFQLKVTLYVILLEQSGNAPDYVKGSWHLKKDGKNVDWSHFVISDVFELEGRYVSFTVKDLEEGNYTLNFNGTF